MSGLLPVADRRTTVQALRRLLRPHRQALTLAGMLFVAGAGAGLVGPLAMGVIVDRVLDGAGASAITGPAIAIAAAAVVQGFMSMAAPALVAHAAEPALAELREELVDRALRLPTDTVERSGTGDLVARADGDVNAVADAVRGTIPEVMAAGLTIVLTVVGMAAVDWRLLLAALAAVPIHILTVRWYLPRSTPLYAAERDAAGARSEQMLETVGGAETVRALGLAPVHHALVEERSAAATSLVMAATRLRTRFFGRLNLAEAIGMIAILVVGFVLVERDLATVGAVTAAALCFQRLFDPINVLLYLIDEAQAGAAALARLVGVTEIPAAEPPAVAGEAGAGPGAAIEIRDLAYAYQTGNDVLEGINLSVAEGERLAIVGASGAGKSTLAKVVAGVHPASRGTVRIGGTDVAELATLGGRLPVVVVTQEVHVYAGTIADDLRLAAPGASIERLEAALAAVGASSWLKALPDGLETVVGDGGDDLTPTQAQQLALARLILADPAVAILDEATAEAGSAGARLLEAAAAVALVGRTAIVIAHRLTQAMTADRIVVLDQGHIVEAGTHDELLARGGRYHALWTSWSGSRVLTQVPAPAGATA